MHKTLGYAGLFVGSTIGWWVGARFSFLAAFLLSMVGTGAGLYVGRRIARNYF